MYSLLATFQDLPDPRHHRTRKHELLTILVIALLAVMCGANSWVEVAVFGQARRNWLRRFLPIDGATPSHDTFGRVFARIDPNQLQSRFLSWMNRLLHTLSGEHIAIDGKAVRGSHNGGVRTSAIHLVNAWACKRKFVLGQLQVNQKSNEITALPGLLAALDIQGCLISIDAMGCQTAIARQIIDQKGDYLLAIKGNQPTMYQAVQHAFEQLDEIEEDPLLCQDKPTAHHYDQTSDADHNRDEVRRVWSMPVSAAWQLWNEVQREESKRWAGLRTLVCVESERQILGKRKSLFHRYYLASDTLTGAEAGEGVRTHWGVENGLHWRLDVIFREDDCRVRTGHAPQNFSLLRKMALNAILAEPSKGSVNVKRLRAALDPDFLLKILKGVQEPKKPPRRKAPVSRSP